MANGNIKPGPDYLQLFFHLPVLTDMASLGRFIRIFLHTDGYIQ